MSIALLAWRFGLATTDTDRATTRCAGCRDHHTLKSGHAWERRSAAICCGASNRDARCAGTCPPPGMRCAGVRAFHVRWCREQAPLRTPNAAGVEYCADEGDRAFSRRCRPAHTLMGGDHGNSRGERLTTPLSRGSGASHDRESGPGEAAHSAGHTSSYRSVPVSRASGRCRCGDAGDAHSGRRRRTPAFSARERTSSSAALRPQIGTAPEAFAHHAHAPRSHRFRFAHHLPSRWRPTSRQQSAHSRPNTPPRR